MADTQYSRVDEGNTCTFSTALMVQKDHKGYRTSLAKLNKPIVRNKPREVVFEVDTNILIVEELEITKASGMKGDKQRNDF